MIEPSYRSPGEIDSEAFALGSQAMRLERAGRTLKPQQFEVAAVLGAGHRFNAITMPRRSTKSTSIVGWEIGRCMTRPEHHAALTFGSTAKTARTWYTREVVSALDRASHAGLPVDWRLYRAAGMERITFTNDSTLHIVGPSGDEFRSQEYTDIIIDEAQEVDPETGSDLLSAILPTMDTNPDAMLVLSGTAGRRRGGCILWDQLERGRAGEGGILEYAAPQTLALEDYEDWDAVAALLERHHPGLASGMTTLEILRGNFDRIRDKSLFAGEYLGVWGTEGSNLGVFDAGAWNAGALHDTQLPTPPARFALAFASAPTQHAAAIVAAWRGSDGMAQLLVVDHREGTRWLADRVAELARRYRTTAYHDDFGTVLVEVDKMTRMRPKPQVDGLNTRDTSTAAAKLVEEVHAGTVRHYDQGPLTSAVLLARRRDIGTKAFAYGRGDKLDDISAVEAASIALFAFDRMMAKRPVEILRPSA